MRPAFLDELSWEMAEVYGAVTDQILINLAHYFPMLKPGDKIPGSFEYQARMLAQMGQVNKETVAIIAKNLGGADRALRDALTASIMDALKNEDPKLRKAVERGFLHGGSEVAPNMMQAFQMYYRQSADKLNLVNTTMLQSTQAAYAATVSDVVQKINNTQRIVNVAAGETITGVSTWNKAMRDAVDKMVQNGITGLVDKGGHRWSPEAYVAMDIRTTMFNTSRAAVWERADSYGADMYQVSSHNGARPLCYPWQGKVISRNGTTGTVEDIDGNKVRVYAESETSKGLPAGLFGINCGHYPMTFIPGFSSLKGEPQSEEENEKTYAESQQQRALERKLREEKRDLEVMKAQGASPEEIKAQRERVKMASADIDDFCDETGRARRRNREGAPVRATWPDGMGGSVTRYNSGYIDTNAVPKPKGPIAQNVAPQATPTPKPVVQSKSANPFVSNVLPSSGIKEVALTKWSKKPSTDDIINAVGGGDRTKGSCASLSFAYAGNRAGYKVLDFRGGDSGSFFSVVANIREVAKLDGVVSKTVTDGNDFKAVGELIKSMVEGKEYILGTGQHSAIIKKVGSGYEYLELQSERYNGFHPLNNDMLKWRFGCKKSHTLMGNKVALHSTLIDVESLAKSPDFPEVLKYINTPEGEQKKGVGGGIK